MAVEIENELTLKDYLSIAKRRWLSMLAIALISLMVISAFIMSLPPLYRSEGFIRIESPVIAKNLIGDDGAAARYMGEQFDKVKQKVFSRENLARLNDKYKLFPGETRPSIIAANVGEMIQLEPQKKSQDGNEWSGMITVGLGIAVEYGDPEVAYNVINDVVSQLLDQNAKARTQRATETTSFLTTELNVLKKELDAVEAKVAQYKQKHTTSLPEHQQMHLGTLEELRAALKSADLSYQATQEELRYLDVELSTANATINRAKGTEPTGAVSALDKARAELDRSMVLYKETHPTVRALKRKVALLEQKSTTTKKPVKKVNVAGELAIAKINSQIQAARSRLLSIEKEKRFTRQKIERVRSQIVKIPEVERGLTGLLRDYDNAKRKYDDVKSKQVNAKIAENLELDNKSERFVLTEIPEFPQYSEGMGKSKMLLFGFLASGGLGFGFGFLMELLDKRVRRQSLLTSIINNKPLVVIPYITTEAELRKKRKWFKMLAFIAIALACLLVGLVLIDTYITPVGTVPQILLEKMS